jgi:hypothetical protein
MDRGQRTNGDEEGVPSVPTQSAFFPTLVTVTTVVREEAASLHITPQIYCTERAYPLTLAYGLGSFP